MPKSRFSFLFTFVVAAALILGFHSSPYFLLSAHGESLLAATALGTAHDFNPWEQSEYTVPVQPSDSVRNAPNQVVGSSPGQVVGNSPSQVVGSSPGQVVGNSPSQVVGNGGGGGFTNPLKYDKIEDFLYALLGFVIQIGYIIAVFFIIFSGFKFVMAQGNSGELDKAKEMLLWTVIGTAVLIGAQVIATVIKATINALGAGGV